MSTQANKSEMHRLLQTPSLSITEIKEWLNSDPALSAFILDTVNGPLFGLTVKVGNAAGAVDLLGIGQLEELLHEKLGISSLKLSISQARLPIQQTGFAVSCSA